MIRRLAAVAATALLMGCGGPAAEPEPKAEEPASAPVTVQQAPPAAAPETAAPAAEQTCLQERGADGAQELVDRCIAVSPATHPPCNADNSCALIQSEVDRGCEMLGDQGPGFCGTH